jgi:iron complex transport system ATP-binding protein
MTVFSLKNLSAAYDRLEVLASLNLDIARNDFVGVIGPNGAGKSTLLKVITGILSPARGTLLFNTKELSSYTLKDLAKKMAVVQQSLEHLMPYQVYDFVATGRFPFKNFWEKENQEDRELIASALEITDMTHLKKRVITELSGGELQLACIARALVQNRNLLILDEPIANLDLHHTTQIMDLLYRLHAEGATIITILHNINIAADYCSRMIALKKGRLICDGLPDQVVTSDSIKELYGVDVSVLTNPVTGRPYLVTHPEYL